MKEFTAIFGFPFLMIGAFFAVVIALCTAAGVGDNYFANFYEKKERPLPPKYKKPTGR